MAEITIGANRGSTQNQNTQAAPATVAPATVAPATGGEQESVRNTPPKQKRMHVSAQRAGGGAQNAAMTTRTARLGPIRAKAAACDSVVNDVRQVLEWVRYWDSRVLEQPIDCPPELEQFRIVALLEEAAQDGVVYIQWARDTILWLEQQWIDTRKLLEAMYKEDAKTLREEAPVGGARTAFHEAVETVAHLGELIADLRDDLNGGLKFGMGFWQCCIRAGSNAEKMVVQLKDIGEKRGAAVAQEVRDKYIVKTGAPSE